MSEIECQNIAALLSNNVKDLQLKILKIIETPHSHNFGRVKVGKRSSYR